MIGVIDWGLELIGEFTVVYWLSMLGFKVWFWYRRRPAQRGHWSREA